MMELPAVVDKLTGYGVTRVEGSEDFSKLKQVPNSITPSRGGKPFLTKRAKVGLIFIVLIIFTGIAVLMHFIYVEKAIIYQQQLLSPKGPVPIGKASVGRGWKLSRLYRHVANHDCDATQASLPSCSTSNSIAKCRRNNEGSRTKRSSVVGKKKTARKTSKKSGQPMLSVQYEEPESIYIVDPDESVYICDKDSDSLYGNDPLCSMGLETF